MTIILIALRLVHILAGILWAGGAVISAAFLMPAVRALGPEGSKFMQQLVVKQKFSRAMGLSGMLTVLAGIALYWRVSGGFQFVWILTPSGITLTIGALAGLIAAAEGQFVIAPTTARIQALANAMQSVGGPPQPAQLTEMQNLQMKLGKAGARSAVLVVIAAAGMSAARYL